MSNLTGLTGYSLLINVDTLIFNYTIQLRP